MTIAINFGPEAVKETLKTSLIEIYWRLCRQWCWDIPPDFSGEGARRVYEAVLFRHTDWDWHDDRAHRRNWTEEEIREEVKEVIQALLYYSQQRLLEGHWDSGFPISEVLWWLWAGRKLNPADLEKIAADLLSEEVRLL